MNPRHKPKIQEIHDSFQTQFHVYTESPGVIGTFATESLQGLPHNRFFETFTRDL